MGVNRGDPVETEGRIFGEECMFEVLLAVEADEEGRWWVCPGFCASPALMAIDVCTHRRKGDVCTITLCLRFLLSPPVFSPSEAGISSSVSRLRKMLAIRAPRALDWVQPPYVRGGS